MEWFEDGLGNLFCSDTCFENYHEMTTPKPVMHFFEPMGGECCSYCGVELDDDGEEVIL